MTQEYTCSKSTVTKLTKKIDPYCSTGEWGGEGDSTLELIAYSYYVKWVLHYLIFSVKWDLII